MPDDSAAQPGDAGASPPAPAPLEKVEHSTATARVPEAVGRGVFATGAIVLGGPTEMAVDFVQSLVRPERLVVRVILPLVVAHRFADVLAEAIAIYVRTFGAEPREPTRVVPAPSGSSAPSAATAAQTEQAATPAQPPAGGQSSSAARIADAYERLRCPDEMLSGVYANQVSITHSGNEFCLDFIVQLFPRSVVAARVYLAASRVPDLLASVRRSLQR